MSMRLENRTMLTLGGGSHERLQRECYDDTKRQYAILDYHDDTGVGWALNIEA